VACHPLAGLHQLAGCLWPIRSAWDRRRRRLGHRARCRLCPRSGCGAGLAAPPGRPPSVGEDRPRRRSPVCRRSIWRSRGGAGREPLMANVSEALPITNRYRLLGYPTDLAGHVAALGSRPASLGRCPWLARGLCLHAGGLRLVRTRRRRLLGRHQARRRAQPGARRHGPGQRHGGGAGQRQGQAPPDPLAAPGARRRAAPGCRYRRTTRDGLRCPRGATTWPRPWRGACRSAWRRGLLPYPRSWCDHPIASSPARSRRWCAGSSPASPSRPSDRQGHRPADRAPGCSGAQRGDAGARRHESPARDRTRSGPTVWSKTRERLSSRSRVRWSTRAWWRSTEGRP